ncbi:hypothetical protein ONE63_005376 [Megalurothrips usitatus]|uniref:Uncharacterized protein n=1 Tax=Megalurothrips usitatus TaxID=439358 RepID=A0AAV7XXS7_9NEOP|nr:hypothetical protein ONE63_005376 [Megalurothrips usitatus]
MWTLGVLAGLVVHLALARVGARPGPRARQAAPVESRVGSPAGHERPAGWPGLASGRRPHLPSRSSQNYAIILESVEGYDANPEFVGADSFLRIRRSDKASYPGMYHTMHFLKPLPNNSIVEVIVYEMQDNKMVPSWLKYKKNFCEYVTSEKRPIFNALAKLYRLRCPVEGVFKVENWRPEDSGLLPPILPGPDRMMFGVHITTDATNILKYGVIFNVDRSKAVRGGGGRPGGKTQP